MFNKWYGAHCVDCGHFIPFNENPYKVNRLEEIGAAYSSPHAVNFHCRVCGSVCGYQEQDVVHTPFPNQIRVECKGKTCGTVWTLAPRTRVKIRESQTDSSTAIPIVSFVCSLCGVLSHYTVEELLVAIPQTRDLLQDHDAITLLRIAFRCVHKGCEIPIIVHTAADKIEGVDERASLLRYVDSRRVSKPCPSGHSPTSLNSKDGAIPIFGDLVWQYYEPSPLENCTEG
jgi:hypothetical protein